MEGRNVVIIDKEPKNSSVNLAINRLYAELVQKGKYDLIARFYKHNPGVILGSNESSEDVDLEACKKRGYEVVSRHSGGSAIVVDPISTLCYSLFFNSKIFGGNLEVHKAYESITIPLAKRLGKGFSVEGTYYLRYDTGSKRVPIAGHAIKIYKNAMQFDGVINLKKLNIEVLSELLRLRELYEFKGKRYIKVNDKFFDLSGKEIKTELSKARLLRSERQELEALVGLEDTRISEDDFVNILNGSLEEIFGKTSIVEPMQFRDSEIKRYIGDFELNKEKNKRRLLGHCFVDFIEEEPKIHFAS